MKINSLHIIVLSSLLLASSCGRDVRETSINQENTTVVSTITNSGLSGTWSGRRKLKK